MKISIKILTVSIIFFTSCSKDDSPENNDSSSAKEKEVKLIKQLDDNGKLLAYYPFNNSTNDESSNNHHGILNSVSPAQDRFGNNDTAYSFKAGGDSYIQLHIFNQGTEFTISAWVKFNGTSINHNGDYFYNQSQVIASRTTG